MTARSSAISRGPFSRTAVPAAPSAPPVPACRYAPRPRTARNTSPVIGFATQPATTAPSHSAAIDTAYCGNPRVKLTVPSIGSTNQRTRPRDLASAAPSSPTTPSSGRRVPSCVPIHRSTRPSTSVTRSVGVDFEPTVKPSVRQSRARCPASTASSTDRSAISVSSRGSIGAADGSMAIASSQHTMRPSGTRDSV